MQLSKCCCGCSLRGGTIGIGIYTLIIGLISGALYGLSLKSTKDARTGYLGAYGHIAIDDSGRTLDDGLKTLEVTLTLTLVLVCLWGLSALMLFVAICSKVRWLLLPWVVFTALFTLFSCYNIWTQISEIINGKGSGPVYFLLGSIVLTVLLNLYFIAVILSYFKVIGRDEGNAVV